MKRRQTRGGGVIKRFKKPISVVISIYKRAGVYYLIRAGIKVSVSSIIFLCRYYTKTLPQKSLIFQGVSYPHFYHLYTWNSERVVEIPIIWRIVKENEGKKILEIGNVLSHYFPVSHDIVDKCEKVEGVINEDVVNCRPLEKYDLIVSISTLEHVGWDEKPREYGKILKAIKHLKDLLSPGGKIVVTLSLGHNFEMDGFLKEGRLKFDKQYYLKRTTKDNDWIETNWDDICEVKYEKPFPYANGLVVAVIENKGIS